MIHIIILSHFICITIGCILFYELQRNVKFCGKQRFLLVGIGVSNIMFALDAFNIYFRHWWQGYSLDKIMGILCAILFCISVVFLLIYFIQIGKQKIHVQKSRSIIIGSVFLLCLILQVISNSLEFFKSIPWACIGYIFFCGVQFKYLFGKKVDEESSKEIFDELLDDLKGKDKNLEVLTSRELEIAKHVCEGKTNKEIAEVLFISQNTVRNHIYNIYKKVGVKNKIELINMFK